MKIYHLSHTDLDGYGCQFVVQHYFKNCEFFNSNYGKEIEEKFAHICEKISKNEDEKALVLITDLNPVDKVCSHMQNEINKLKNAKLLLLDHHATGLNAMNSYEWYFLDDSRCATKIVYDFFSKLYGENEELALLVDNINAIDIWLSDSEYFEFGKILLQLIASTKELNRTMFAEQNLLYKFYLLKNAMKFMRAKNGNIELENQIHFIKKDFFKAEKDDTLCNMISHYLVRLLSVKKQDYTVFYKGYRGLLAYDVGNVSVVGNDFLVQNPEYDFFLEINPGKRISLRANNKIDVSEFAKHAFNGGGHKNASGGIFASFKDSTIYEKIYEQTKNYLERL